MESLVSVGMEVGINKDNGIDVNPVMFGDLELVYSAFKYQLLTMLFNGVDVDKLMSGINDIFKEDGLLAEMTKYEAENKTIDMTKDDVQKLLLDKACQMLAQEVGTVITGAPISEDEMTLERPSTLAQDLGIVEKKIIV